MTRIERAAAEAALRTNGQATQQTCEGCFGSRVFLHQSMNSSTGRLACDPCCTCGGDGLYFQIRNTQPILPIWELLGEPRPRCITRS